MFGMLLGTKTSAQFPSRNQCSTPVVKTSAKADIKGFWSCPFSVDFLIFCKKISQ